MLTDAIVKDLEPKPNEKTGKPLHQWIETDHKAGDDPNLTCRGFGVKVMASGTKTYVVSYRFEGREREYVIGAAAAMKVAAARKRAVDTRQIAKDGRDPQGERVDARDAPTVRQLAKRAVEEHFIKRRASTRYDVYGNGADENTGLPAITGGQLRKWILPELGNLKVADVRPVDIENLHTTVTRAGSPIRANRCVSTLSKMFSLAIRWEMRSDNPCKAAVDRNAETKRKRYLKQGEIATLSEVLAALSSQQAANAIRLLLLTGARSGETLSARWDQFDLEAGTWAKPDTATKQKADHQVPLSAPARVLLAEMKAKAKTEYVFPGRDGKGHMTTLKTSWKAIRGKFDEPTRVHDLRHSLASILVSGGASLPLIGSLLGHSNPNTTNRYAHLFLDPQRTAIETAGAVIMGARSAEVVPLQK
jgi:integrase